MGVETRPWSSVRATPGVSPETVAEGIDDTRFLVVVGRWCSLHRSGSWLTVRMTCAHTTRVIPVRTVAMIQESPGFKPVSWQTRRTGIMAGNHTVDACRRLFQSVCEGYSRMVSRTSITRRAT